MRVSPHRANGRGRGRTWMRGTTVANDTCSVDGCDREHHARGYCGTHYRRWRLSGDAQADAPVLDKGPYGDAEARWLRRIAKDGPLARNNPELGPCWRWLGWVPDEGYPNFSVDGRTVSAYRWAYEHFIGPVPDGLELDHFACDRGRQGCVNPYHCRPATRQENQARVPHRNSIKTHCPQGHPYDEANTRHTPSGGRICRACHRASEAERARRKREAR